MSNAIQGSLRKYYKLIDPETTSGFNILWRQDMA